MIKNYLIILLITTFIWTIITDQDSNFECSGEKMYGEDVEALGDTIGQVLVAFSNNRSKTEFFKRGRGEKKRFFVIGTCYNLKNCENCVDHCENCVDHCLNCIKSLTDLDNSNSIWRKCQPDGYYATYNGMVSNDLCKLSYKTNDV